MNDPKTKHREAAYKAWKTIKEKKRAEAVSGSIKLEEFLAPVEIAKIDHPEELSALYPLRLNEAFMKYRASIVKPFIKTPPTIVCGKFWELRWAFGCPYDCAYCYLRGTFKGDKRPRFVRLNYVLRALDEVFKDPLFNDGKPTLFNSGELADSLMKPELMEIICDKFEEQSKHKLLLLTKAGPSNIQFLLKKRRKQVVCARSLNAVKVAKLWERAPSPIERIRAAKLVYEAGYPVWIRIDPVFPIEDWEIHYEHLLYKILDALQPRRIILGTPRGLWKTIHYAYKSDVDTSWIKFFEDAERTDWGLKLRFELRREIYTYLADKLREMGYQGNISLCKETDEMWKTLGWRYVKGACQCYGEHVIELYT